MQLPHIVATPLNTKLLFVCFEVDELLALVDGVLRSSTNQLLKHDMQWNALCRAFELRFTSGDPQF